jgi:exopolysaccharide biosynthesis polyprenyl glycosylphosphotransferase
MAFLIRGEAAVTVAETRREATTREREWFAPAVRRAAVDVWQARYRRMLVFVDLAVILISTYVALHIRFGSVDHSINGISYTTLSLVLVVIWMITLVGARAYEMRFVGTGADEFKRVGSASLRLMGAIAVVAYIFKIDFARGYVAIALPLGTVLLLLGRYGQRRWLHARRRHGAFLHRVLAVGGPDGVRDLAYQLEDEPYVGMALVGACLPTPDRSSEIDNVPVLGTLTQVISAIEEVNADTVVVTAGPGMTPEMLRRLSWDLEGTGIGLVVAPELLDVAGPRISVRPVPGLPLLHVEEPELSGPRQAMKATVEWVFATAAFILVLPILAVLCLLVRLDSPGAPLFTQTRVGRNGREFTVYKLRTMHADAETLLEALRERNEAADGLLFKIRDDPRITRVGKWLRRWSLDEVPQLWNVVRGDMALVGPRPPLPGEVSQYEREVARRLLVRPGITGLWQVSGRSNLTWDESIRLDLYYVENWSLALDAMIVWKTIFAVFRRDGAY